MNKLRGIRIISFINKNPTMLRLAKDKVILFM